MANPIGTKNLAVLREDVFQIPKARPAGRLDIFLSEAFRSFRHRIAAFEGPLAASVAPRVTRIGALCVALEDAFRAASTGDSPGAYSLLAQGLQGIREDLVAMSRRHTARILPNQSWYRLAAWGASTREHMFHAPFEMTQKAYRFSIHGEPAIYLGNSVYLCWLECGQPERNKSVVSRFEIDSTNFDFLDLPCGHWAYLAPLELPALPGFDPRHVTNSPYLDNVVEELAEYLTVWPLLAAVSVRKYEDVPNPPEYFLPQLLMKWVARQENILGIRYLTSKEDRSTNSQDWPVNLALPSRVTRTSGYCPFLVNRCRVTLPQPLRAMDDKSIQLLVTKESGDRRHAAGGRNMLQWPGGGMEPYIGTVFGKMEYWLDRDDIEVAAIQNP